MNEIEKKKYRLSSIRYRLLFLICLSIFPAFIFTFIVADQERRLVLKRAEDDALHIAKIASREHSHQITGANNLIRWLSNKVQKDKSLSIAFKDPEFLKIILASHPQLANIGILKPNGEVWVSAYPIVSGQSFNDNPAFKAAIKSIQIEVGNYLVSPIFKRPTLNHALALKNDKNDIWAVIFTGLDLDWLNNLTEQAILGDGIEMLILDDQEKILAKSSNSLQAQVFSIGQRIVGIKELSKSTHGKLLKTVNNTYEYFVSQPLEGTKNLYVAISLPHKMILKKGQGAFTHSLAILITLMLFTIIVVFLSAEIAILKTLRMLSIAVKKFGSGDYSTRVKSVTHTYELDLLSNSFNKMADSIEKKRVQNIKTQKQLRALNQKMQTLREDEAKRISRELHDELGQELTTLKMNLAQLKNCCGPYKEDTNCANKLYENIELMNRQIFDMISFIRKISSELRPSVLDKLGLSSALEWIIENLQNKTEVAFHLNTFDQKIKLASEIEIALFRITQEALTNTLRHSKAQNVYIDVSINKDDVILEIKDDGIGINVSFDSELKSLGIIGMKERAELLNGQFSISSNHDTKGTLVKVIIPLQVKQ